MVLKRANGILAKLRYYVPTDFLKSVYYSLFDSHLKYAVETWGQNEIWYITAINKCQNKALRIINFKDFREPSMLLFEKNESAYTRK